MKNIISSRELVKNCISFKGIDRLPYDFPPEFGSDFFCFALNPNPDHRPATGPDEWGVIWENIGVCNIGQVKLFPLQDWSDLERLCIPDINDPMRWEVLSDIRNKAGEKFLLGLGNSIFERIHFLRGLENTCIDTLYNRPQLELLIDKLVQMNIRIIDRYADAGVDGIIFPDDWGIQNCLIINPQTWREIWKPRYKIIFSHAHSRGMLTFLHSCGYIIEILHDLIDCGLDVIQLDQQENMGLNNLSEFKGLIAFYSPVDVQGAMARGNTTEICDYCYQMVNKLGTVSGGFIPKWYPDPIGAGHTLSSVHVMCNEFLKLGNYKKSE